MLREVIARFRTPGWSRVESDMQRNDEDGKWVGENDVRQAELRNRTPLGEYGRSQALGPETWARLRLA